MDQVPGAPLEQGSLEGQPDGRPLLLARIALAISVLLLLVAVGRVIVFAR